MAERDAASPAPEARARVIGRRAAMVVYWGLALWIGIAGALNVTLQVFSDSRSERPASCREGLTALTAGLDRARAAAAESDGTEDEALERFRGALGPIWASYDALAEMCRKNPEEERALDAIQRLRYAEEHAVRREAGELAPLRRRVQGR